MPSSNGFEFLKTFLAEATFFTALFDFYVGETLDLLFGFFVLISSSSLK
jgi:hypothetical protein